MIAVVLDTNVLASGFVGFLKRSSTPGRILHAWRDGRFALVSSAHILTELESTLRDPYFAQRLAAEQIAGAVALLRGETSLTDITARVHGVASH